MSQVDPVALLDTVLDAIESGDVDDVRAAARLARMAYPKGSTLASDFAARLKGHTFHRDQGNHCCVLVPDGQAFDIAAWDNNTTGDWYEGFGEVSEEQVHLLLAGDVEGAYGKLYTYDELVARFGAP